MPQHALYFEPQSWDAFGCNLCPLHCSIAPNRAGQCGVRVNRGGEMRLETWGRISFASPVTPDILPLYHFNPWLNWMLVGQRGCNMRCAFCNTSKYSLQGGVPQHQALPHDLINWAAEAGCTGVSFGGNEPVIAIEYVMDVFDTAHAAGRFTHLASNGYIEEEPLRELCRRTSAMTIGIKGPTPAFYDQATGGDPRYAIQTARVAAAMGVHVELTYMVLPGATNTLDAVAMLAAALEAIGPSAVLILLAFEPSYFWQEIPGALPAHLDQFRAAFGHMADRVYCHHAESPWLDTRCPSCQKVLVRRGAAGYLVTDGDRRVCPSCAAPLPFAGLV